MGRGGRGERRRYWRELLTQQRRSGMSVTAFCRRHDLSAASFYGWRQRLADERRQDEPAQVSFVPLPIGQAMPAGAAGFVLELPNGVQVTVPRDFDEAALARLLPLARAVEARDA